MLELKKIKSFENLIPSSVAKGIKSMTYPKLVYLEAILMDNNEVLHFGKSLGFINKKQKELVEAEATKLTKPNEVVVALNNKVA